MCECLTYHDKASLDGFGCPELSAQHAKCFTPMPKKKMIPKMKKECGPQQALRCTMRGSDDDGAIFKCMSKCIKKEIPMMKKAGKVLKMNCFKSCYAGVPECEGCMEVVTQSL